MDYVAYSSSLLSEEQFLCSICLDVFTEPVSTSSGHNFCKACISGYWDSNDLCQCPMCKEKFYRRPELRINTLISEMAAQFRKSVQVKATSSPEQCPAQPLDIPCDFCTGMKLKALKSCLVCLTSYCETHLEPNQRVAALKRRVAGSLVVGVLGQEEYGERKAQLEKTEAEVQQMIQERLKKVQEIKHCPHRKLEQEITELQRRSTELEQLSHTEDHLHLLQSFLSLCTPPPTKDWSEISVHSDLCVGTVRRAVSQLEETLNKEMEKLPEVKLKRIQQYAVDVTLDPDTAHPNVILSEDGKQVRHGDTEQDLPDKPVRFSTCLCILGKKGFSSGRFYYEVTVKGKTNWDLGVARESINRKGKITLSPEDGYWTVWLRNGEQYTALSSTMVLLHLSEKPQKVGVFVDYEEGQVSFYDVEARSHIYSFTGCTFTEKLYPYFSPNVNDDGKNSAPLIISPVNHKE
eukprot:XP_014008793.1 PREDICTED: E3 ubiquitin-protein ligase TRIM39-like [Salmo salar]